ncbi:MAG: response regulator, partial [Pseudomonadota bacterium]
MIAGTRVLVADDDHKGREILADQLIKAGAAAAETCSIEQAFQRIQPHAYDALFIELSTPDSPAFNLLENTGLNRAGAAVIVTSSVASVESAVKALKLGVSDFVVKPLDREKLITLLDGLCKR